MSDERIDLENLSEEEELQLYGYKALRRVPQEMSRWNLRLDNARPSRFGHFVVVDIDQATIETHHQIIVIDEHGEFLSGIGVGFFFPGGDGPAAPRPAESWWDNAPIVNPTGNFQITDTAGYALHTYHSGGETLVCWHIDEEGTLRYPSAAIYNAIWLDNSQQGSQDVRFLHTGVKATFQLRRPEVQPMSRNAVRQKIAELERRVAALEANS